MEGKLSKFKAGSNQDALTLPSPATQPDAANGATEKPMVANAMTVSITSAGMPNRLITLKGGLIRV